METVAQEKGTRLFTIIVNGREHKVAEDVLSFTDVVKLAYPTPPAEGDIVYTVTFHNADQDPKNGALAAGEIVKVRSGTRFDVKHAVRS